MICAYFLIVGFIMMIDYDNLIVGSLTLASYLLTVNMTALDLRTVV